MIVSVDYTQVGVPPLTLTLEREASGFWIAVDERDGDTVYFRSPDLGVVTRFMRAFALRHDVRLNEAAVAWARAQQSSGGEPQAAEGSLLLAVSQAHEEPASPPGITPEQQFALATNQLIDLLTDPHSRRVDSGGVVIPFKRGA